MAWRRNVEAEFARFGKHAGESVSEELAQHAAATFEAACADGDSPDAAPRRRPSTRRLT